MNKKQIIHSLETIAIYLEFKNENPFKIAAYRRAARALETDERSLDQIDHLNEIKGIGKGTASVISELIETGESELLNELRHELPEGLLTLLKLPGLGAKKIAKLYQELGITDMTSLKKACEEEQLRTLDGFGDKSEEKLLKAILQATERPDRLPLSYMLPLAQQIEQVLSALPEIEQYSRAGSLRRLRETMKDLDYVIATLEPERVSESLLRELAVKEVVGHGNTKMSIQLKCDYQVGVDFRFVEPKSFATALHHFTGSKEHNVLMRQLAKSRGEKISEYGVLQENETLLTFKDETSFFRHFDLAYIPPECREGNDELEQARTVAELNLIEESHINGDLHMHTTWSDGAYSLEEMVEGAIRKGYSYIVITDHSKSLKVANGLTEERLREQIKQIQALNEKYQGKIHLFSGVEMDILPDGRLDYADDILEELDFVIAAIHSSFSQSESVIMKRLENAMRHPKVRLIAHPTGRIIGKREGYAVNQEQLFELASETGTALELNANPHRLDLSAEWLMKAKEKGIRFCINTDAHSLDMLDDMSIGVKAARKAWLTKEQVINTYSLEAFQSFLRDKKR
ncbi:DNA polymerase/3'-5' exonuclease PolX [Pullulanibacillus sp. KACC 23026]|uniref:DNA polymerase/3'-5' exonuclease PolX n=1 Tax=Pullulanibacillus sp. KACC 23026 TaxID=3028315 RepID=UPI0023AEFD65|nr:DNA polymerase/3'-5' exonuclease PolX [Pullulanibacillus sp. KACC 23026]WEG13934.1 DNA polymerase/3'-5' exonuclease PolX [Pullulanibacillus sp. KACC 23026]